MIEHKYAVKNSVTNKVVEEHFTLAAATKACSILNNHEVINGRIYIYDVVDLLQYSIRCPRCKQELWFEGRFNQAPKTQTCYYCKEEVYVK